MNNADIEIDKVRIVDFISLSGAYSMGVMTHRACRISGIEVPFVFIERFVFENAVTVMAFVA